MSTHTLSLSLFCPISLPWRHYVFVFQVLDAGEITEFDEPYLLLKKKHGVFKHIVGQTGRLDADKLMHMARQAFVNRHTKDEIAEEEERNSDDEAVRSGYDIVDDEEIDIGESDSKKKSEWTCERE